MTFGKWNTDGELTWVDHENPPTSILTASDLNTSIQGTTAPIGSRVAWHKSMTGTPSTLPSGWVECNGQTLDDVDSPLNGQVIPDLNVANRFVRGSVSSGGSGGEATTSAHSHSTSNVLMEQGVASSVLLASGSATSSDGGHTNLPVYFNIVWIMRVK